MTAFPETTSDPIRQVESFVVPYLEPNDHNSTRFICLVKVTTHDGATGWGEGVTLFEEATRATAALVDGFADLLVGVDPDPALVLRTIDAHAWWYGDAGIASFAKSAIDIAVWDLICRKRDVSLLEALGGGIQKSLPTVISCHATLADLDESAEMLAKFVRTGHARGIKVGFGKRGEADLGTKYDRDLAFVRRLRQALGDEPLMMIDIGAGIKWSVDDAINRTKAFEDHGLYWIEEPLGADNPQGYRTLHDAASSLIAYGEREWNAHGIERIVATGSVDVVGVDPGRAEGISGFVSALTTIEAAEGTQANAHAFAGPITYAASLALSLSSTACRQLEVPPHRNAAYDLVDHVPTPVGGRVTALNGAGLGFSIDENAVRSAAI